MNVAFDLVKFLEKQRQFSEKTFGPGDRTDGIVAHIAKELVEIKESRSNGERLGELVDVVILALDAMWRLGFSPEEICMAIFGKQNKNIGRKWQDWRTLPPGSPVEHVRDEVFRRGITEGEFEE